MPLFRKIDQEEGSLLMWNWCDDIQIQELNPALHPSFQALKHPKKKREFLMIQKLLAVKNINQPIQYEPSGKPYLESQNISISHSFEYAAIFLSNDPVGVDIQKVLSKIHRIKHKFCHPVEVKSPMYDDEIELTKLWSSKEAVYKLNNDAVEFATIQTDWNNDQTGLASFQEKNYHLCSYEVCPGYVCVSAHPTSRS